MMNRRTLYRFLALTVLAGLLTAPSDGRAEDPPPQQQPAGVQQTVHKITGLFSADREADLGEALKEVPGVELVSVDLEYGEATFSYDAAVAFPGANNAEQVVQHFDQKLTNACRGTFRVKPRNTTPREQLTLVEMAVEALDCKGCALAAYEILANVEGVEQASVDFKAGRATAMIDPNKTSREKLEAVLKERGVTVQGS